MGARKMSLMKIGIHDMSTKFIIQSSNPELLEKATGVAKEFVQQFIGDDVVGIVFLGAIA